MSGLTRNPVVGTVLAATDPSSSALGLWGSKAKSTVSKFEPGGTMLGLYGKSNNYSYDPVALKMGLFGYDIKKATDPNSYNYEQSTMASRRLLGGSASTDSGTSRTLLGQ